jgi:F-type H+-transporting ATPase subunit delta
MFRRATTGILARTIRARLFSTGLPAAQTIDSTFAEAWKKVAPNLDPPKTPLSFMQPRPPTPSAIPSKLTVNFVLPYASEISGKEVRIFFHPGLKMCAFCLVVDKFGDFDAFWNLFLVGF